jgi:hypothetical protein
MELTDDTRAYGGQSEEGGGCQVLSIGIAKIS